MKKKYLGIDIGGTAAKLGIVDETGCILLTDSCSVNFDSYQTPIIDTVIAKVTSFLEENQIAPASLTGIGVSATGQINSVDGIVAGSAGHIANWLGTPIKDLLENKFHLPVTVANDANCAILGEQWKGAAQYCDDAIMVTIGTGVGGGIITNGQLLSGSIGIAGELGHFPIKKDGWLCSCGNHGCYEQYASTTALVKAVQAHPIFSQIENIDGKYIFQQLKDGNSDLAPIVSQWMNDIAAGLIGLIHIFNPERVIIGGGVSLQQELFIKPLSEIIYAQTMPGFRVNLSVCAAKLGNNAGLLGAVSYFREKYENGGNVL